MKVSNHVCLHDVLLIRRVFCAWQGTAALCCKEKLKPSRVCYFNKKSNGYTILNIGNPALGL